MQDFSLGVVVAIVKRESHLSEYFPDNFFFEPFSFFFVLFEFLSKVSAFAVLHDDKNSVSFFVDESG
jgi:hypothetical protein